MKLLIAIAQFRYIKIQLETKDVTTRLRGIIMKDLYGLFPTDS